MADSLSGLGLNDMRGILVFIKVPYEKVLLTLTWEIHYFHEAYILSFLLPVSETYQLFHSQHL